MNARQLTLLHKTSLHGWNRRTLLYNCRNFEATLVLIRTNYGRIIGGYSPDKWEDGGFK